MKKLLLACGLAFGIGVNAQFYADVDFSGDFTNTPGVTWFGGGGPSTSAYCSAPQSFFSQFSSQFGQAGGPVIDFSEWQGGQTDNGKKIDVSINYRKPSGFSGTLNLVYAKLNTATNQWSLAPIKSVAVDNSAINTCQTLSGTIPAGTLVAGETYAIGAYFQRAGGTSSVNFYYDDLKIVQENPLPPACVDFVYPTANAVIAAGSVSLSWKASAGASEYKVSLGTSSGASDVYSGTISTTTLNISLEKNANYFMKVIPTNNNGDAEGCTEISFSTNAELGYCAAGSQDNSGLFEKITNVKFADIDNSSTSNTSLYEDFTSVVGHVEQGGKYTLTVVDNGESYDADKVMVWIDYDQNGSFDDAGENVYESAAQAGPWEKEITIPEDALAGNTRMRIRLFDSEYGANATPCGTSGYGEVEDYTINVKALIVAPTCTTITTPADGATDVDAASAITWTASEGATGYKVYVGTTTGNYDVENGTEVTDVTYTPTLAAGTQYFAKVVPFNEAGEATGCTEISFTTKADSTGGDDNACEQGVKNTENTIPNAYKFTTSSIYRLAEDFKVGAGGFSLNKITIDSNQGEEPSDIIIHIRANDNGRAGAILYTITKAKPDASVVVGSAYGDPIYHSTFNLDTPIDLEKGTYWIEPSMSTASGMDTYWALVNYNPSHGLNLNGSNNNGATWQLDTSYSGIFTVSGICGESDELEYCDAGAGNPSYEKITNVKISNEKGTVTVIDNSSSSNAGYEDFTTVTGNVNREAKYNITVTDNGESYVADQIIVWIDYNQNGSFDDPGEKAYESELQEGPWTGNITIPEDAVLGNTRMRIRLYDTSYNGNSTPCGYSEYGQVEDYTINIAEATLAVSNNDISKIALYPNPFHDVIKVSDAANVKNVYVSDLSGRRVKTLAPAAELNLSSLQQGVYIITLQMKDGSVQSQKVIKK